MAERFHKAPDLRLTLSDGASASLKDYWKRGKLVLVFLRHFG